MLPVPQRDSAPAGSANRAAVREHKSVRRKLPYIHGLPKAETGRKENDGFRESVLGQLPFARLAVARQLATQNRPFDTSAPSGHIWAGPDVALPSPIAHQTGSGSIKPRVAQRLSRGGIKLSFD